MIFSSEDEITNYYKNYAQCLGYGIGKISTKNGDDGKKYFTLACSRARKYVSNSKNLLKPNRITKSQCKGRLKACMSLDETVIVSSVVLEHNHELIVEANGYENLTFGEKDCRNYIGKVRRLRLGTGDAKAIQNYFVRMQKQNSLFYYVMDMDDKSCLQNVLWVDTRCRAAYEYFGEIITFDTTYLTNKYDMPFTPFVGVNHHG
ncbi:hypothetical protein GYH30_049864 [Glycine max]|uniref:Uncharacterized protein n=1 Tax=Glycine max TaxID=3847 RepID=A0A0R0EZI8_SOYBN|nr:hypothetical protein GYH30_049864 [Glycine max]